MQQHIAALQVAINNYTGKAIIAQGVKLTLADAEMILMALRTGTKMHYPSAEIKKYMLKIGQVI